MRHFLRELQGSMSNCIDLGRLIKQFSFKWVKLNSEILSGGVETLIKLLEKELVRNPHARKNQKVALKIALRQSKDIVVDGYIMDGNHEIYQCNIIFDNMIDILMFMFLIKI